MECVKSRKPDCLISTIIHNLAGMRRILCRTSRIATSECITDDPNKLANTYCPGIHHLGSVYCCVLPGSVRRSNPHSSSLPLSFAIISEYHFQMSGWPNRAHFKTHRGTDQPLPSSTLSNPPCSTPHLVIISSSSRLSLIVSAWPYRSDRDKNDECVWFIEKAINW